ncbi:hypothetical protein [Planococcus sp. 4-30]|uniref:hypothetical protein n=1 Tax=Planococcus sp. 4-30 TaxID=2874583 RepID=UPI001CBC1145|nr:hypothetical protein [Planococcus sp. 4-30]
MLLNIDDSLITYLKNNSSNSDLIVEEVQALNNLSLAHRDRKHILIGTLNAVEFLKDFTPLDHSTQRVFSNLYSKFSFMGAYEEIFDSQILIKSREHIFSKDSIKEKIVFQVPITEFIDSESINRTALIGEDRTDCEFYEGLAKKYLKEKYGDISFSVNFHPENGGGDSTWKALKYYSENKKISITIADSDKRYPKSTVGNTLKKLRTEYKKHENNAITELVELTVREKENLIPPSFYLYCCNSSDTAKLKKLSLLEKSEEHFEKLFYLDYKEGLRVGNYKSDPKLQEYLIDSLNDIPNLASCRLEDLDVLPVLPENHCLIEGISTHISEYFSKGVFYNGLEKDLEEKLKVPDIPKHVIDELRSNIERKNKMFKHMPESFQVHLNEICKKLVDWGCSNNIFIST